MKPALPVVLFAGLLAVPTVAQDERPQTPQYHHDDGGEPADPDGTTDLDAAEIEYEFFRCMETVFEYEAAVRCHTAAATQYEQAIRELVAELRPFMTPRQREAFDASHARWERHLEAEKRFLQSYWDEFDREWGEPMRTEAILNLFRMRYDALDHIPRD